MRGVHGWVCLAGLLLALAVACSEEPPANAPAMDSGGSGGRDGNEASAGGAAEPEPEPAGGATTSGTGGATAPSEAGQAGSVAEPTTGTVSGVVRWGRTPIANVTVLIDGAATMTAADGTFTVADAAGDYQLTLISAEHQVALVVDGLRSREPSVQLPIEYDERSSRSLTGLVSGDLDSSASFVDFAFVSPEGVLGRAFRSPETVASYGFGVPLNWAGPEAQAGTLYALQGRHVGAGVDFTGFAEAPVSWTFEEELMADLVLVDPPQLAFEGTFTIPKGYEISFAYIDIGPFELPLSLSQGAFSNTAPRDIPLASSVRFLLNDATSNVIIRRGVLDSGMLSVDIPAAAKPLLPIDDATGVSTTTMFSWTEAPANTISSARFSLGDWTITRIVRGQSTTLPDLASYGLPLPTASAGTWTVRVEGPAATVDELLALQDLYPETQWWYRSAPDLFFSDAHAFSFTTAD